MNVFLIGDFKEMLRNSGWHAIIAFHPHEEPSDCRDRARGRTRWQRIPQTGGLVMLGPAGESGAR